MVDFAKPTNVNKYLITDMGVYHLLTTDNMWVPMPSAHDAYLNGDLLEFNDSTVACRHVTKLKRRGCYTQVIPVCLVPWDKVLDLETPDGIDWVSVKELVKAVLEQAVVSEDSFRSQATAIGVSYEDFLAAAITQLIQQEVE